MPRYTGSGKKVTSREMKKTIMQVNNWTAEQYRRNYDIFKNKLRAYESYRKAHGADITPQSPQALLYRQAKAIKREGAAYQPSIEMKRIQSFSAVSITKGRRLAQDTQSEYSRRRGATFAAGTTAAFAGMIEKVDKAAEIVEMIEDPVKREEALRALAEHIHAKQQPSGEVFATGETYGSDTAAEDFDIEEWLE